MRKRHSIKPTVCYTVDNPKQDKKTNENCLSTARRSTLAYLKPSKDSTAAKLEEPRGLPHNVYPFRPNHKYEENFKTAAKTYSSGFAHNNVLHLSHFRKALVKPREDGKKAVISASIIVTFFLFSVIVVALSQ